MEKMIPVQAENTPIGKMETIGSSPPRARLNGQYKIVATFDDGSELKISRSSFRKCLLRAGELGAISLLDQKRNLWVQMIAGGWSAQGVQPKPDEKMKKIE